MSTQEIYNHVAERYSAASRGTALEYGASVAKAFGYSEEELANIPKESNLGLSCGNPMAMASIREVCCLVRMDPNHIVQLTRNSVRLGGDGDRPGKRCRLRCFPRSRQGRPDWKGHRRRHEQGKFPGTRPSQPGIAELTSVARTCSPEPTRSRQSTTRPTSASSTPR